MPNGFADILGNYPTHEQHNDQVLGMQAENIDIPYLLKKCLMMLLQMCLRQQALSMLASITCAIIVCCLVGLLMVASTFVMAASISALLAKRRQLRLKLTHVYETWKLLALVIVLAIMGSGLLVIGLFCIPISVNTKCFLISATMFAAVPSLAIVGLVFLSVFFWVVGAFYHCIVAGIWPWNKALTNPDVRYVEQLLDQAQLRETTPEARDALVKKAVENWEDQAGAMCETSDEKLEEEQKGWNLKREGRNAFVAHICRIEDLFDVGRRLIELDLPENVFSRAILVDVLRQKLEEGRDTIASMSKIPIKFIAELKRFQDAIIDARMKLTGAKEGLEWASDEDKQKWRIECDRYRAELRRLVADEDQLRNSLAFLRMRGFVDAPLEELGHTGVLKRRNLCLDSFEDDDNKENGVDGNHTILFRKLNGQRVVLKCYQRLSQNDELKLETELEFLGKIQHPNVAQARFRFSSVDGSHEYIVFDRCEYGSLTDWVKFRHRSVESIMYVAKRVVEVVHYLNITREVVHCDVKPANIFVTAYGAPMLGDFDVSRNARIPATGMQTGTRNGTHRYMAPELLRANPDTETSVTDVYSLGLTLIDLLEAWGLGKHGDIPNELRERNELNDPNKLKEPKTLIELKKLFDLNELAKKMSSNAPGDRPTIQAVLKNAVFAENPSDLLNRLITERDKLLNDLSDLANRTQPTSNNPEPTERDWEHYRVAAERAQRVAREIDEMQCVVCQENLAEFKKDAPFKCGHVCVCVACAKPDLISCPRCAKNMPRPVNKNVTSADVMDINRCASFVYGFILAARMTNVTLRIEKLSSDPRLPQLLDIDPEILYQALTKLAEKGQAMVMGHADGGWIRFLPGDRGDR